MCDVGRVPDPGRERSGDRTRAPSGDELRSGWGAGAGMEDEDVNFH